MIPLSQDVTDDAIHLHDYYFPFGSRRILLSQIDGVSLKKPTLWKGK
jgi:hypothetical protein